MAACCVRFNMVPCDMRLLHSSLSHADSMLWMLSCSTLLQQQGQQPGRQKVMAGARLQCAPGAGLLQVGSTMRFWSARLATDSRVTARKKLQTAASKRLRPASWRRRYGISSRPSGKESGGVVASVPEYFTSFAAVDLTCLHTSRAL